MKLLQYVTALARGWIILSSVLIVAAGCAATPSLSTPAFQTHTKVTWNYAVVIDASSTASTLYVYQWRKLPGQPLEDIKAAPYPRAGGEKTWSKRVKPGLSSYEHRPEEAARSLQPLIDYALDRIGDNPEVLARSSLYLRGTAGLRLLDETEQEEILSSIQRYLGTTPFGSTSARVISGEEEGVFGWIAVNYQLGHLTHGGPFPTVGALDLGGASTQITFVPLDYPTRSGQLIEFGGTRFHLYTHSYLELGQDRVRQDLASPACFLSGYPIPVSEGGGLGTGDYDRCRDQLKRHLAKTCSEQPCSLFGVYQPPPYGEFLAFSVYAYTADFFELDNRLSPRALAAAGSAFCSQDWNRLLEKDPPVADDPYLPLYCFAAAYVVTLLTDGFGFPMDTERITAPLRVQGAEVGWTLGALAYELAGNAD